MKILLINPNIVSQKNDFFGTGIPYMPIGLAYLGGALLTDIKIKRLMLIDMFGLNPERKVKENNFIIQGISIKKMCNKIKNETFDYIFIYASQIIQHNRILKIIKEIKKITSTNIVIIENTQSVVAYSLRKTYTEFFKVGATFVICGEPEIAALNLINNQDKKNISGLIYKEKNKYKINNIMQINTSFLDSIIPVWDLIPLNNYWELGYAHAPINKKSKYIALQTSRGCNNNCSFCIIPFTNKKIWRGFDIDKIIENIKIYKDKLNINEIHIEDLNATLYKNRIEYLCQQLIKHNIKLNIKFPSGIKLDTIDYKSLKYLKRAGCSYISFSPESGSKRILKLMKKTFDYKHGIEMTKNMNKLDIKCQACFVLGYTNEKILDRQKTEYYIKQLVKAGVDEIALFIMTPLPGSKPYEMHQIKKEDLSKLTFSPTWRKEYKEINKFRNNLYIKFLVWKLMYHPIKLFKQGINLITRNFETKMEMTIYRIFKTHRGVK